MAPLHPMLRRCLLALNISGLDPRYKGAFPTVRAVFVFATSIVFVGLQFAAVIDFNGLETLAKLDQFPTSSMYPVKIICLAVNRNLLLRIVTRAESFWSLDKYGKDVEKNLINVFDNAFNFFKMFCYSCFFTGFLMFIKTFITGKRQLMFGGYDICDLNIPPCFEIQHSWQFIITYALYLPLVLAFDGLFFVFIAYSYTGLELVKESLRRIKTLESTTEESLRNIAELVEEHNNVLQFTRDIKEFFSSQLLFLFWSSTGSLIFAFYMVTSSGFPPEPNIIMSYGFMMVCVLIELFLYSTAGNILMDQTVSVAEEAYDIDWYAHTQPTVRKSISFIIMKSQKPEILTIGKLNDLNLNAFLNVTRNACSVLTLLRTIEQS